MAKQALDRKPRKNSPKPAKREQYKFGFGDPGLFLELYLPTKFDVLLTSTLDDAFQSSFVKDYLVDHLMEIRSLLAEHESFRDCSRERIHSMSEVFKGYSLYHGSGAYAGDGVIEKESVTIARMMFLPPLSELEPERESERVWARRFLRFWTHDLAHYEADRKLHDDYDPKERKLVERLVKWLDDIGLLVNGYVVHRISDGIQSWRDIGTVRKLEDEIWVGSLRCLAVNRVTFSR